MKMVPAFQKITSRLFTGISRGLKMEMQWRWNDCMKPITSTDWVCRETMKKPITGQKKPVKPAEKQENWLPSQ